MVRLKLALAVCADEPESVTLNVSGVAVMGVLAAAALLGVYWPLSQRIDQGRAALTAQHARLDAIAEVEGLRKQADGFRLRIGEKSDTNEWVQYILGGLRKCDVKLRDMESKEPHKVGPYMAIVINVELDGSYAKLKAFMEWLDQSDRLLRVDMVRLEKRPDTLLMRLSVLGLVSKNVAKT